MKTKKLFLRLPVLVYLIVGILLSSWYFSATAIAQTKKIQVSPIDLLWSDASKSFAASYTVYNHSETTQELSSIIVFKSAKVKWWRGVKLPIIAPKSSETFSLSFPAYIMLKNNYESIYVNL